MDRPIKILSTVNSQTVNQSTIQFSTLWTKGQTQNCSVSSRREKMGDRYLTKKGDSNSQRIYLAVAVGNGLGRIKEL